MVKKIVTHTPPRHIDDTLAVALLMQKYPEAEVEFVHPQDEEKLSQYREDPDVILVDVGGDYNPELKNYDHHQNLEIPFSLTLVLENEFPEHYEKVINTNPLMANSLAFLDYKDRFGPKKVQEITGIDPTGVYLVEEVIKETALDVEGMRTIGRAFMKRLDEQLRLVKALENIEERSINSVKVLIDREGIPASLVFQKFPDAHLLVQPNSMNRECTSLVRNSNAPNNPVELKGIEKEAIFVHKGGFLAVLPENFESVVGRLNEVVNKVVPDKGIDIDR